MSDLENAYDMYTKNPTIENLIWYGRRMAYTGKYDEAIEIYTKGFVEFGDNARLYRHRGHRYISTRQFEKAKDDFEIAVSLIKDEEDEVEEDGIPNAKNIPLSTLFFNIYYHLGLVYYLLGDFKKAKHNFKQCLEVSKNDDSIVACKYWLFLSQNQIAMQSRTKIPLPLQIGKNMDIIENFTYYDLLQLFSVNMVEAGDVSSYLSNEDPTLRYGLAMWFIFNGRKKEGMAMLNQIMNSEVTAAFGYIAAEAEIERFRN